MSYVRILVHAVWGTKHRSGLITDELKPLLLKHILKNAKEKDLYIHTLNAHYDHVHCLLYLNSDLSISRTLNLIKGESSFWVNNQKLSKTHFGWAVDYYAASVSDSEKNNVVKYIKNQESHHKKLTYQEEFEQFLRDFGLQSQA